MDNLHQRPLRPQGSKASHRLSFIFLGPTGVGKTELTRTDQADYGVRISKSGAAWAKWEGLRVTMRLAPLRRAKVAWSES